MRIQTWLYSIAQALAITCAVISVSISPMVGKALAPNPSLSTLAFGAQFATIIFCSYLLSMSMKRFGRKPIFYLGAAALALGGSLGALSIYWHSFAMNVAAHVSFGITLSAFAFFRFAATDGVKTEDKAKVLSLVTLGGIVAAFIGPELAKQGRVLFADFAFSGSYLIFVAISLLILIILCFLPKDQPLEQASAAPKDVGNNALQPAKTLSLSLFVAIYSSGFGYMVMGLLMMQASMRLNAMGVPFTDIMFMIQCHVMAMFVPSLFMGKIIAATSAKTVIFAGYVTMTAAMLTAIYTSDYQGVLIALIGVGIAWNMLYVGGSSLVASLNGDQHKLQGINESAVAVLNTIGAFSAGMLFHAIGWENSNWLAMLLLAPGLLLLIMSRYKSKPLAMGNTSST